MSELPEYTNHCPKCNLYKEKVSSNADIDAISADDIIMWEYECNNCHSRFKVPVPRGPKEEKQIRCTECNSINITRNNTDDIQVVFCGG